MHWEVKLKSGRKLIAKILYICSLPQKIVNSYEITGFWKRKEEGSYRKTLDGHTRKEKEYLSSLHLGELQNEDDNNKKEFGAKNDEDEDDKDGDNEDGDGGSSVTMDGKALIDVLVPDEDSKIVERNEPDAIGRTKRWILSSETDVGQVLTTYRYQIPESQKCIE